MDVAAAYITSPISPDDARAGFTCGKRALDEYLLRHAVPNEAAGVGRTYVLRRQASDDQDLPALLGFYTLSMATLESARAAEATGRALPRYPMPVALIGRLAIDLRARGRRLGERLLVDALRRVLGAAGIVGCIGVVVDAKDEDAERFYAKYDFVVLAAGPWPRRMFLPMGTVRASFSD